MPAARRWPRLQTFPQGIKPLASVLRHSYVAKNPSILDAGIARGFPVYSHHLAIRERMVPVGMAITEGTIDWGEVTCQKGRGRIVDKIMPEIDVAHWGADKSSLIDFVVDHCGKRRSITQHLMSAAA